MGRAVNHEAELGVSVVAFDPLWSQFSALLPERVVVHPLSCHRPRIPDRVVFDKLVQALVLGAAFIALANAIIIVRRLLRTAWTSHRWDTRPSRRP